MIHRLTDFHACWVAVKNESSCFGPQHIDQLTITTKVFFAAMYGRSQGAVEFVRCLEQVFTRSAMYDHCCRSKDLFAQLVVLRPGFAFHREYARRTFGSLHARSLLGGKSLH